MEAGEAIVTIADYGLFFALAWVLFIAGWVIGWKGGYDGGAEDKVKEFEDLIEHFSRQLYDFDRRAK